MKRTSILLLVILVYYFSACCHVNNLQQRKTPVAGVEVRLGQDPQLTLQFTRRTGRQSRMFVGVLARTNKQSLKYEKLLQDLGGARLRRHLSNRIQEVLSQSLGWMSSGDDTVLGVEIVDMIFEATDILSSVTVTWRLEAMLSEVSDGSILWRRCIDWSQDLDGWTMEGLLAAGTEHRERFVDGLASRLAKHLARLLAEDLENSK